MPFAPSLSRRCSHLTHFSAAAAAVTASSSASAAADPPPLDADTVLETLSLYANDWPRALDFFNYAAARCFPHTPATIARTVSILGKHFEFSRARSLLLRHPPHPLPLRALLNRLAAARLVADAVSLSAAHPDPSSFHLLIHALCAHRHVAEAHRLCFSDRPLPADTKIHNMLLGGWSNINSWSTCKSLWEEMDRRGVPKDLRSYTIYLHILAKSGKPYKALKLYKEMKHNSILLDTVAYNTVINAAAEADGPDESVRLYRKMLESGCQPNSATFNIIIKMLCREGRIREGYAFLNQMRKRGCEPDVITYHCFFQYLMRPKEIMWLFERMCGSGCRPRVDTYTMLIKKFGRWGFLRPVMVVWKAMKGHGCSPDAFAYNALIDALLERGMVDTARKYDEEMLEKGLLTKPRREFGD